MIPKTPIVRALLESLKHVEMLDNESVTATMKAAKFYPLGEYLSMHPHENPKTFLVQLTLKDGSFVLDELGFREMDFLSKLSPDNLPDRDSSYWATHVTRTENV